MTKLKKKCDKLWAEIIRSKGYCEICGKKKYLNAHHIASRSNHLLRYDVRNGCCLCSGHHTLCNDSAHKDPLGFYQWLEKKRPEDLKYLLKKKKVPPAPVDYDKIYKQLNEYTKSI